MTDNRVLVKAPYGTTERTVQEFLLSKKDWITKHLEKQNDVNNICYVINLEDEPYEEFKESSYYNVQIGTYPPMRFYFRH